MDRENSVNAQLEVVTYRVALRGALSINYDCQATPLREAAKGALAWYCDKHSALMVRSCYVLEKGSNHSCLMRWLGPDLEFS